MKRIFNYSLSEAMLWKLELVVIVAVACFPLLFNLPFRDNIYLSWEGAYRMYLGQMPFEDFGMPMGYGYWILPALSFHLFGPYFFSLIKIQVLINLISGIAFIKIIKGFSADRALVTLVTIMYVISYSFFNYWPWYNHTVIVYEFVGLALLLMVLLGSNETFKIKQIALLSLSALFAFLSFFTKQDGGAFALLISGILILYHAVIHKTIKPMLVFGVAYLVVALCFILPAVPHEFNYWFNYGQEPHYSRISLLDLLSVIFGQSQFIKLYFLVIVLIVMSKCRGGWQWFLNSKEVLHLLLTLGILFQASVLQVTSYVPVDGNLYFHSFMIFYILCNLNLGIEYKKIKYLIPTVLLICFWWSGLYWTYASRIFHEILSPKNDGKNIVSMSTYTQGTDSTALDKSTWGVSSEAAFAKIKMPQETIAAIEWLKVWKANSGMANPKILNMSELTPLAHILGYELETDMPLWYHLNVAMFDRELLKIEGRIKDDYYDLVLYEYIPQLNNFYPFEIRQVLGEEYELIFTFQAPREFTSEFVEVYAKKKNSEAGQLD